MSIKGVICDICGEAMPERPKSPYYLNLGPVNMGNGRSRRVSIPIKAFISEFQKSLVPNYDGSGKLLTEVEIENQTKKPEDLDACEGCTFALLAEALKERGIHASEGS